VPSAGRTEETAEKAAAGTGGRLLNAPVPRLGLGRVFPRRRTTRVTEKPPERVDAGPPAAVNAAVLGCWGPGELGTREVRPTDGEGGVSPGDSASLQLRNPVPFAESVAASAQLRPVRLPGGSWQSLWDCRVAW